MNVVAAIHVVRFVVNGVTCIVQYECNMYNLLLFASMLAYLRLIIATRSYDICYKAVKLLSAKWLLQELALLRRVYIPSECFCLNTKVCAYFVAAYSNQHGEACAPPTESSLYFLNIHDTCACL